ncbi:MAG: peptidase M23, partial [Bacteroidetes bacterium]
MPAIKPRIQAFATVYGQGLLNSYAQIFFSKDLWLAGVLLLATFVDLYVGLSGLAAVVVTQLIAAGLGFDVRLIQDGSYSYNPLMVGMVLGIYFEWSLSFLVLHLLATLLTFLLTVWLMNRLSRSYLPFLSLPFLAGTWLVLLAAGNFAALAPKYRGLFSIADLSEAGGPLALLGEQLQASFPLPDLLVLYLRSLGAIMFQYNLLAGLLIALGLLYHSRMSFLLSLIGFFTGFAFYRLLEGDMSQLVYSYIGFNFILTAIALGGFFLVPSRSSFLLVVVVVPIIALLISALGQVFESIDLPLYSLPFNLMVLLLLAALGLRLKARGLHLVQVQQFSPERNHYKFYTHRERFEGTTWFQVGLPFLGEWYISQGHDGPITHREEWKEAWDFDVRDGEGQTYRDPGVENSQYYCFNLPVCAPAEGYVVALQDQIPDNEIGGVNLDQNWGNSLVIKHGEQFFSQLSHLRKGSLRVKVGDYVRKGQIIGTCGSSGRSPEPHLHFQLQATPHIGARTLRYPLAYYLVRQPEGGVTFHTYDIPKEGETVSNVTKTPLLSKAFALIPGKTLTWLVEQEGRPARTVTWEIQVDAYNRSYFYEPATGAAAYFVNDQTLFYFTDFYGRTGGLLHHFYLGAQRVLLGYYREVRLSDPLLIDGL